MYASEDEKVTIDNEGKLTITGPSGEMEAAQPMGGQGTEEAEPLLPKSTHPQLKVTPTWSSRAEIYKQRVQQTIIDRISDELLRLQECETQTRTSPLALFPPSETLIATRERLFRFAATASLP